MKRKQSLIIALVVMIGVLVVSAEVTYKTVGDLMNEAREVVPEITAEEAFEIYQQRDPHIIFLDVRTAEEVEEGHIPGATWIARGLLEFRVEGRFPDRGAQKFIVYCRRGGRSLLAAQTLIKMGYEAINVKDGFNAWRDLRFPMRRGLPAEDGVGC
ncbi:hypothetical protein LR021_03710 [Candidatus Bipolaricaulota bacterium]|nr:hypothetical protein [Candidatus Bipolaricaulota bacterium]